MSGTVLGLDTSNYRTSLALVSTEGEILLNRRMLLPVARGERGLRQSDAVYAHLKQMKELLSGVRDFPEGFQPSAVCASTAPRDRADSYMPVFEVGDTMGRGIAAAMGIPFFPTDHQHGHIRAAMHGTGLSASRMLALHLSGGTTDLILLNGESLEMLGSSLDLHAGQLMDRVGVALGCGFPSGPEMEEMAKRGRSRGLLGCAMENGNLCCHLSGAETRALGWIRQGEMSPEEIAREIFDLLARTAARMLAAGAERTRVEDALVFGGIASSLLFREMLADRIRQSRKKIRITFGDPELSGDNAVGVALIGADLLRRGGAHGG